MAHRRDVGSLYQTLAGFSASLWKHLKSNRLWNIKEEKSGNSISIPDGQVGRICVTNIVSRWNMWMGERSMYLPSTVEDGQAGKQHHFHSSTPAFKSHNKAYFSSAHLIHQVLGPCRNTNMEISQDVAKSSDWP